MSEISGYVEQVTRHSVRGWAYDAADPARPVLIEVLVDDRPVAVGTTDQPRPDLARADTGRDTFGFAVSLPDGTPIELHRIKVRVAGSGEPIPMAEEAGGYEGFVEVFEGGSLKGWGWRCGYPEERVRIVVRHKGDVVGSSLANQLRPDLIGAGVGDGRHAFLIALPMVQRQLDPALLFAEFEATGAQLTDLRYPDRAPPPPRVIAPPRAEPAAVATPLAARAAPRPAAPVQTPVRTPIKTPIAARPPMTRMPTARATKAPAAGTPAPTPPAAAPRAMPTRPIVPHPVARPAGSAPVAAVPVAPSPPVVVPAQRTSPIPPPPVAVPGAAPVPKPAPAVAAPASPQAVAATEPAPVANTPASPPIAATPAPPAPPPATPVQPAPTISKELLEALRGSLHFGDEGGIF